MNQLISCGDTWRRRAVKELGALEDVLVALRGEHQIVVGQVVPHEAVLVAPGDDAMQITTGGISRQKQK